MRSPTRLAGATAEPARWPGTLAKALALTFLTALVFGASLAVTMPASILASLVTLPPQVETLSGSAWRGRAGLAGGHVLDWSVSGRGLWRGRLLAEASLEGPDTRLSGLLALSPWAVEAHDWTGRAGSGLLALAPGRPVASCDSRAMVEVGRLALGRRAMAAEGEVRVAEGACTDRRGATHPLPALVLVLSTEGPDALARLAREDGTPLAGLVVTGDRRILLRIEPEGAALVPGLPSSAPTILEIPF